MSTEKFISVKKSNVQNIIPNSTSHIQEIEEGENTLSEIILTQDSKTNKFTKATYCYLNRINGTLGTDTVKLLY